MMYSKYIPLKIDFTFYTHLSFISFSSTKMIKSSSKLYSTTLLSSTIIKFNLFTELCVARLTGNEGRKVLLGLG